MFYDVGVPCKHGHTCGRYVVSRKCVDCAKAAASVWNKTNPEKHREHSKRHAAKDPSKACVRSKIWRNANPDRVKANNDAWQAANREKFLGISAAWKRRNRPHVYAASVRRRAAQDWRTPPWLTQEHLDDIKKFYALAVELSAAYGSPWHVDHIMPLRGATVSGLHVPWNLQVLPGSENMRKGNRVHG